MAENVPAPPQPDSAPDLPPWSNVVLQPSDPEIEWIERLEQRAQPLPPDALAIRELITRFEICHFKAERHIQKILEAIGNMRLDFTPASIGKAHPKSGEAAWRGDKTGRSRQGRDFIWALQLWLEDRMGSEDASRPVPLALAEEVNRALGARDAWKNLLVAALVNRLLLRPDGPPLPAGPQAFWESIERTDICHYAFPSNLRLMLTCIGRLEPPADFPGCGSCGDAQRRLAREWFCKLCAWLRGQPEALEHDLGPRTPLRLWLAACLAKTLKEHAALQEALPCDAGGGTPR
jgi:hypothetical protein